MTMPIEFMSIGDQYEEKGKLELHLNGKCDDGIGLSELIDDSIEFRHFDFANFLDEKFVVLWMAEVLGIKIIVFAGYTPDEAKQIF